MSGESPVVRDLLVWLDRIGLRVVTHGQEQNAIFSPLSAALMCGCLTFLCEPCDREKLVRWMGFDPSVSNSDLADGLKWLKEHFEQDSRSKMYSMLAVEGDSCIPSSYIEFVKDRMGIDILRTTFPSPGVDIINRAVKKATRGKITNAVDDSVCESKVFVNAVYFRGDWEAYFDLHESYQWHLPHACHSEDLMGVRSTFKYSATRSYQYVGIPYQHSKEMEIFMMKNSSKLPVNLTADDMAELRAKARPKRMALFMPAWEQKQCKTSLKDVLAEDGVVVEGVSNVSMDQMAMIEVTEEYTEVAAVSVGLCADSLVEPPVPWFPFIVDRPFIYTIRSGPVTEFMGYFYDRHPGCPYFSQERSCEVA